MFAGCYDKSGSMDTELNALTEVGACVSVHNSLEG